MNTQKRYKQKRNTIQTAKIEIFEPYSFSLPQTIDT